MTESEAIKMLEIQKPAYGCKEYQKPLMYAYEMAIKALEKQIPKKPMFNGTNWYRCVNGCEIHKKQFEKDWYCPKCGQKLDWSDEE